MIPISILSELFCHKLTTFQSQHDMISCNQTITSWTLHSADEMQLPPISLSQCQFSMKPWHYVVLALNHKESLIACKLGEPQTLWSSSKKEHFKAFMGHHESQHCFSVNLITSCMFSNTVKRKEWHSGWTEAPKSKISSSFFHSLT